MTGHAASEPEGGSRRDSSSEKRERRRIPAPDIPDLEPPELRGLVPFVLNMRHEGWELEDLGFRHTTKTRANDPPVGELLLVWTYAEEARIRGDSVHDFVYRKLPNASHATVDRRIAAAQKLLEKESEWRPALSALAANLAQD